MYYLIVNLVKIHNIAKNALTIYFEMLLNKHVNALNVFNI